MNIGKSQSIPPFPWSLGLGENIALATRNPPRDRHFAKKPVRSPSQQKKMDGGEEHQKQAAEAVRSNQLIR
jgi:hypothetical protein